MVEMYDVAVIGGGPAGLSAALWLGRYRRKTVVLDAGEQRNLTAEATHGYLTLDGESPSDILNRARAEIGRYPTVELQRSSAEQAEGTAGSFSVRAAGKAFETRRVLIASGVADSYPDVAGFDQLYGRSIFHCSCCDGYESERESVVAIGWGRHVAGYALDLLEWGARVVVVTDGMTFEGDEDARKAMAEHGIEVVEERVGRFEAADGHMSGIELASGRKIEATRAFFSIAHHPRTEIARQLGCSLDEQGYIVVGEHGETSVPGVYAAGDVTPGEQLIQVAAAEGTIAGISCAMSLRGATPVPGAPKPGPDPDAELDF